MGRLRTERVGELLKQEVSKILLQDIKDPRVGFVTVTRVKMTSDLRSARIFISLLGDDEKTAQCLRGLESSLGYIRREIGQRVRLRYTPELSFEIDKSMEHGAHIQKLLGEIMKSEGEAEENENHT